MYVSQTLVKTARLISQRHVNPLGTLYGGYMLQWVAETGNLAAMSFARGNVVLGFLDKIHFVAPVRLGDLLIQKGWVVGVRRSSMSVLVESYVATRGDARLATVGKLIFVKISQEGDPEPVGRQLQCDVGWEGLCRHFEKWRAEVDNILKSGSPEAVEWPVVSQFVAMPEDSLDGALVDGGRLLARLDELTFVEAYRYYPAIYVTASVNRLVFRKPIYVGDIVTVRTKVTHVGTTSIEVGFSVEALGTRGKRRVADGFFTFVNMSRGEPTPIEAPKVGDIAAAARREENIREAKLLKSLQPAEGDRPWLLQLYTSDGD